MNLPRCTHRLVVPAAGVGRLLPLLAGREEGGAGGAGAPGNLGVHRLGGRGSLVHRRGAEPHPGATSDLFSLALPPRHSN
jgi:hypothetical protein